MKKITILLLLAILVTSCASGKTAEEDVNVARTLIIEVGDVSLVADLADNSSARALTRMLSNGPLTLSLHDYGNFEKVGPLPALLPRNDEPITTEPGDLILYLGSRFVLYYDTNSWNFTRLGKIRNVTGSQLKDLLGSGDVTVVLSLGD